jgi:hypothetical protein
MKKPQELTGTGANSNLNVKYSNVAPATVKSKSLTTGAFTLAQHLLSYYRGKFTYHSDYPEHVQADPLYELVVQCRQRGLEPMDTIRKLIDAAAASSKADLTPFQFGFKALAILDRIDTNREGGHE